MENEEYARELEKRLEALTNEIAELKGALEKKSEPAHDFSKIKTFIDEGLAKVVETLRPVIDSANNKFAEPAKAAASKAGDKIASNPFTSIVVALSAGIVIGKLIEVCVRDRCYCYYDDEDE